MGAVELVNGVAIEAGGHKRTVRCRCVEDEEYDATTTHVQYQCRSKRVVTRKVLMERRRAA